MINLLIKILSALGHPPVIKRGNTRIVWVFPRLRLALKFPLIHIRRLLGEYYVKDPWDLLWWFQEFSTECYNSPRWYLFKGLRDNWMEFVFFWRHCRQPFLFPTYFSFFGFFTITPLGKEVPEGDTLWSRLLDVTNEEVLEDHHHFSEERNFCFYKGFLRMWDYGSRNTRRIICSHFKSLNGLAKELAMK